MTNLPEAGHAPQNYTPENIAGKAALVSGGTTGIGLATARLLVSRGARVLIFGRHDPELQDALRELGTLGEAHGLVADVSQPEDVSRVFQEADAKLGGVDILVANAGIGAESLSESEVADIRYVLDTNLLGSMLCSKEAARRMTSKGSGHIVAIGSMSAKVRNENAEIYVASKSGMRGFYDSLSKTLNPKGIKVTLIEPGLVQARIQLQHLPKEEQIVKEAQMQEKIDAQTMIEAQDLAEAVHYVLTQPKGCVVPFLQVRPVKQII